ncbi:MAG: Crp/Fnr family transcriptional regulator [Bacteroidetes bacterium MedPE-SWsnd-G2]|nr:MAG: Crp/Fnr family transcriptional regulator [Bacteroidetes bacterium MedPE-SWsnd-G2]
MSKCDQCIVKQFNALKSLTKDELIRISNCKTAKHVKKGEIIFDEGDILNGVYCVRDGVCKLTKLSANGKDQVVKLNVKGDLIGQRSLIVEESTNLQATALTDMELCFIPKSEIIHDLKRNPEFSMDLMQQMAHDLRDADDIIVYMAQKSVKQRIAATLLYMEKQFGVNEKGAIAVALSREDYATIVGTATESAIRILSQFKKDGLISTEGKFIKIEDPHGLEIME